MRLGLSDVDLAAVDAEATEQKYEVVP